MKHAGFKGLAALLCAASLVIIGCPTEADEGPQTVTVLFADSETGTVLYSQKINKGATVRMPVLSDYQSNIPDDMKDFSVKAWYTTLNVESGTTYDFTKGVPSDLALYSKWTLPREKVADYLTTTSKGTTPANPALLPIEIDLTSNADLSMNMTRGAEGDLSWKALLKQIDSGGKYVALDISDAYMGTGDLVFDPTKDGTDGAVAAAIKKIVRLRLPDKATAIKANTTFEAYTSLKRVYGEAITTIPASAFKNTPLIQAVFHKATTIGASAFEGTKLSALITSEENMSAADQERVSFFREVTTIGASAFSGCAELTEIQLSTVITTIGENAFKDCGKLDTLNFEGLTTFPANLFSSSNPWVSVEFENVTTITDAAFPFKGTTTLTKVSFPSLITVNSADAAAFIAADFFKNHTALESVDFGEATAIGSSAFEGCTALKNVAIQKADSIGASAFKDCTALSLVNFGNATAIGVSAFEGCEKLGDDVEDLPFAKAQTIGDFAFKGCKALTGVTFQDAATIGVSAFEDCINLGKGKELSFGKITTIASSTFKGCTALSTITFGSAVTTIGSAAFSSCTGLRTINLTETVNSDDDIPLIYGGNGSELFSYTINDEDERINIVIPASSASSYSSAWKDIGSSTDTRPVTINNSPLLTMVPGAAFGN